MAGEHLLGDPKKCVRSCRPRTLHTMCFLKMWRSQDAGAGLLLLVRDDLARGYDNATG